MITFGHRCAECGAVEVDRRLSLYRFPMVACAYQTRLFVWGAPREWLVPIGEATLVRQLCSACRPTRKGGAVASAPIRAE